MGYNWLPVILQYCKHCIIVTPLYAESTEMLFTIKAVPEGFSSRGRDMMTSIPTSARTLLALGIVFY